MGLIASLVYYKNNTSLIWKCHQHTKYETQKNQEMESMGLCALWSDSFINNQNNDQNIENKKYDFLLKSFRSLNKSQWGINPMGLFAPWVDT